MSQNEETNFDELDLDEQKIKLLIKARKKELKSIFRKYQCPEHRQYAKLEELERANGAFNIKFSTCCEKHRKILESKC